MLSDDIKDVASAVREGTQDIVSTLNWGFSEVLLSLRQMSIQLDELVRLTRTPSQTWACEQFEIARDEFRRQLYAEALQSVTRAIEGLGSNSGIRTEFRFHFLVGTIRLGSYKNSSSDVVSPQVAEQSFLAAARYAQTDYPNDTGQALICAGRAAYVQGAIDRTIAHLERGLAFTPNHAEGRYQLGRALFFNGTRDKAQTLLADAILLNVEHSLRAIGDPDFVSKPDFLNATLRQASARYKARYEMFAEHFRRAQAALEEFSFGNIQARSLSLDTLHKIRKSPDTARASATTGTLVGFNSAISHLVDAYKLFPICFNEYKTKFVQHHREQLANRRPPPTINRTGDFEGAMGFGIASAIATFIMTAYSRCSELEHVERFPQYVGRHVIGVQWDYAVLPALIFAVVVAAIVIVGVYQFRLHTRATNAAVWTAHREWTEAMEKETSLVQSIEMPAACRPPALEAVAQLGSQPDAAR